MTHQRIPWLEYKNELQHFNPELATTSLDTPSLKQAVTKTLQVFLPRDLSRAKNADIDRAMQDWRAQAAGRFGAEQFERIVKDAELFRNEADRQKDQETVIIKYLIGRFGYLNLVKARNYERLKLEYAKPALDQYVIDNPPQRTAFNLNKEIAKLKKQIEKEQDRISDDEAVEFLEEWLRELIPEIEKLSSRKRKTKRQLARLQELNNNAELVVGLLERNQAGRTAIANLTERLHELEEIENDVVEVSPAEALAAEIHTEATPENENARTNANENFTNG